MKINLENPSLLTLRDYNLSRFLLGILVLIPGLYLIMSYLPVLMEGAGLAVLVVGLGFILLGIYVFSTSFIVSIYLDKGSGRAEFSHLSIFKPMKKEVGIRQILDLTLMKDVRTFSKRKRRSVYFLVFKLDSGEELPFSLGTGSALIAPDKIYRDKAQQVAEFLGIALKEKEME